MQIERYDNKPEPRAEEIHHDWKTWATENGYAQIAAIPLKYEGSKIVLEIWNNPTQVDSSLIYLPPIPHAARDGGEKLFITDQEHFAFMVEAVKKMATMAMILAHEKWKERQNQKTMLN